MRIRTSLAVALLLTGCAGIPEQDQVPTNVFFHHPLAETQGIMIEACASAGDAIASQTANTIVCEKELTGAAAFWGQLAVGNSYSTTPVAQVAITLSPIEGGTRVYWQTFIQTQMAFGQVRRMAVNNPQANATLRERLVSRGAE